jgi:hypothetical protein
MLPPQRSGTIWMPFTGARSVAFVPGTGFAASVNPLPIVNLT